MLPEFQRRGVELIAISDDSVDVVARAKKARDYSFALLADPEHEAMAMLGLQYRGLRFKTIDVFGMPFGVHTGFREMFLPASVLVNEAGVVRWIDISDDYRMRGSAEQILEALDLAFFHVSDDAQSAKTKQ